MNYEDIFEVIEFLGRGRFGEVFLVQYRDFEKNLEYGQLALKRVQCDSIMEANETLREMYAIGNLTHGNILQYHDCFIDEVEDDFITLCIVMEYCAEGDFERLLNSYIDKKEYFSEEFIMDFISQVGEGLMYLHKNNIIHRDIKPGNIMIRKLDEKYVYKLGDFGLMLKYKDKEKLKRKSIQSVGSVRYFAPEVSSNSYGDVVDVFSLAVVVYEMITKDRSVDMTVKVVEETNDDNMEEERKLEISKEIKRLVNKEKYYSQELRDLLFRMIEPDKDRRITANVLCEKIERIKNKRMIIKRKDKNDNDNKNVVESKTEEQVVVERKHSLGVRFIQEFLMKTKKKLSKKRFSWKKKISKPTEKRKDSQDMKLERISNLMDEIGVDFNDDDKHDDNEFRCKICMKDKPLEITNCHYCNRKICLHCTVNCFKHHTKCCTSCKCMECIKPRDVLKKLFKGKKNSGKKGLSSLFASIPESRNDED